MSSSDRDNAGEANEPPAVRPSAPRAEPARAALDEALGFRPLDAASPPVGPPRGAPLTRPRVAPPSARSTPPLEARASVRSPALVKLERPEARAHSSSEPTARAASARALERPIVHPRARAALAPAPRTEEPRPLQLERSPPPTHLDEEDEPVFESTLRGLNRAQLTQLASVRTAPAALTDPPPRPLLAPAQPAPEPEPLQPVTATHTVMRAPVASLLSRVSLFSLLLLVLAFLLPTANGAPWELLTRPAEVSLQALAAFVLIGVVHLTPARDRTRALLAVVLAALLLPFAFVALRHAVVAGTFDDGPPVLAHLIAGALPTPALPALIALVSLPAALMATARRARPWATWTLAATGLVAVALTLVALPTSALFAALSDAPFLGDRIAAWLTLPLLFALPGALAVLTVPRLQRAANALAFATWAAALLPLLVLALFSAKSEQWQLVLEPIKLVAFLGAITLYLSAALAACTRRD